MAALLIVALRACARCVITQTRPRAGRTAQSGTPPHFSFSKCHPCSRLTLSPIFPVAQPSRGIAVHIAIASDKSQPLIESVRRLPRGPGRKLNSPSAQPNCTTDCLLAQGCAHTTPSDRLVHHHVLDPGPHTCRDSEDDKCEHTDDSPSVPAVSRYQHHAGLGLDNLANQVRCRHGALRDSCGTKRLKAATSSSSTLFAVATSIPPAEVEPIAVWLTFALTGRRRAKRGGYPQAALAGGPVERGVSHSPRV